ncbi:MAG: hypothetical protein WC357_09215 [Candidatus Omnitrophota bacterium]|jgi:hypothetical protein
MRAIICAVLFFSFGVFSFLQAEELSLPLPPDAVKVSEKSANAGLTQTTIQIYTTAFSKDRINAMYKKEMAREGWAEQKKGAYSKDGYMAIIVVNPRLGKDNKTQFSITTAKMPTKEDVLASSKDTPDKLDFMPVYPGSKQNFLFETPAGLSASYNTGKSINEVIFFFKSAMLGYGWKLSSETPITTETKDCPECRKAAGEASGSDIKIVLSKAGLTFRRTDGESCIIKVYQGAGEMNEVAAKKLAAEGQGLELSFNKTTILVIYHGNKKITQ